ncbi:MAG: aldehyde dehydrogenase family protein [Crocinitomicaceae bacterium]|nr:aldehyde dehydrogenase family protein [Crocinitomicaceae bacterium]MDG1776587.1 aldehyde dehydrogenase family protein [Crocinitomicaceae bacterium]
MKNLDVLKTYKIYIGGSFPRTESGRYYTPLNQKGEQLGNICQSSRKDVRNSVVAARKAFGGWSERTAFNRGQILYRIAEMLQGRKSQFIEELIFQGSSKTNAEKEVNRSIDRLVYYAGWCDKYMQILGSVNPVASSHFNFSIAEPTGVVGVVSDQTTSLIGLVSLIAPIIAGGNTCVVLASEGMPLCAVTFAEVLNASDVPGGVVNILTGSPSELIKPLTTHMDVNAMAYSGDSTEVKAELQQSSALNLKRISTYMKDWMKPNNQDLYLIADFQEIKTTWHPIENIGGSSSVY